MLAIALAYAIGLAVAPLRPWVRPSAVGCLVAGLLTTSFGIAVDPASTDTDTALYVGLVLAGGLHLVAWIVPGFRGRPILLGLGLAAIAFGIAGLITSSTSCDDPFDPSCFDASPTGQLGLGTVAGVFLAVVGSGLLVAVRWLDRNERPGIATTIAATSIVLLVAAAGIIAADIGETGGSLLVSATGVALGVVGHLADRRAMTWTGAVLAAFGLLYAVLFAVEPDAAATGGLIMILTGLFVAGAPRVIGLVRSTQDTAVDGDGDEVGGGASDLSGGSGVGR